MEGDGSDMELDSEGEEYLLADMEQRDPISRSRSSSSSSRCDRGPHPGPGPPRIGGGGGRRLRLRRLNDKIDRPAVLRVPVRFKYPLTSAVCAELAVEAVSHLLYMNGQVPATEGAMAEVMRSLEEAFLRQSETQVQVRELMKAQSGGPRRKSLGHRALLRRASKGLREMLELLTSLEHAIKALDGRAAEVAALLGSSRNAPRIALRLLLPSDGLADESGGSGGVEGRDKAAAASFLSNKVQSCRRKLVREWICCASGASAPEISLNLPPSKLHVLIRARGAWDDYSRGFSDASGRLGGLVPRPNFSFEKKRQLKCVTVIEVSSQVRECGCGDFAFPPTPLVARQVWFQLAGRFTGFRPSDWERLTSMHALEMKMKGRNE